MPDFGLGYVTVPAWLVAVGLALLLGYWGLSIWSFFRPNTKERLSMANQADITADPRTFRVTVVLPERVWLAVEDLAKAQGCSRTEMLRRAISTELWRHEAVNVNGATIIEERPHCDPVRLTFPY